MLSRWLIPCLLLSACGSDEYFVEPQPSAELDADNMYSLEVLPRFYLELDEVQMAALEAEPKVYVPGRFSYDDTVFEEVGVRLKGNDTLTPLSKKPSFKVKFNAFVGGQRFLGREGLTLNNMHADPSMLREWLGYEVFRNFGVPAPRVGYAQVSVNGEDYGLYLNLEPYNDDYLQRTFADPHGNLYEGEHGDDVQRSPDLWDQDEGDDLSRMDLTELRAAMQATPESYFYGSLAPIVRDEFLGFVAAEAFLGHFDGYQSPHNFFVYHEPTLDKWFFLPWNLDQTFYRASSAFFGDGYLTRSCLDKSPRCLVDYVQGSQAHVRGLEALHLDQLLEQAHQRIDWAARGDIRKRHSNETMDNSRAQLNSWVLSRVTGFGAEVDCLEDGKLIDNDSDGWSTCFHDCRDDDPEIHFGAPEVCDAIDNDCNGFADDVPACPCPSEIIDGTEFFFCTHVIKWYQARDFCAAQGHQLAKLETFAQNARVWEVARSMYAGAWAIGLNDSASEDTYVYLDGSEPTFTSWASGEPAKRLPIFDCAFYTGAVEPVWMEGNCNEVGAFVCSAKP